MPKETPQTGVELINRIADGSIGPVEFDKGGNYSKEHGVWVDERFNEFVADLEPGEKAMIETFTKISLATAVVFNRQIRDSKQVMWPEAVFKEGGADLLATLIDWEKDGSVTLSLTDPYSTFGSGGFDWQADPYSVAYHEELEPLRAQLETLMDYPGAEPYKDYIAALLATYKYNPAKNSDFTDMWEVDNSWGEISPDVPLLFMAEPTETYLDPARPELEQNSRIAKWADKVKKDQGLPPWRTFMEFRLLIKDKPMITEKEVAAIRNKSRELFASPEDQEVPVSLEFRRLLLSSGNGTHPAKTAKNYPNQVPIRKEKGYKNILYTNMIINGVKDNLIPTIETTFGKETAQEFAENQLIRGRTLGLVGHEENHPIRIFTDSSIEELKSSVDGLQAILESDFSKIDIKSVILTEIASALFVKTRMNQALEENDDVKKRGSETYYKAATILMNFLWNNKAFLLDETQKIVGIDYNQAQDGIKKLVDELETVHSGNVAETVPQFHQIHGNEKVWDSFDILELK